jgi:hypothetical protein
VSAEVATAFDLAERAGHRFEEREQEAEDQLVGVEPGVAVSVRITQLMKVLAKGCAGVS